jgi:choline/glycine/proline betaine transport protein
VIKAFESIRFEFKRRHLNVVIKELEDCSLSVDHHDEINFIYKVMHAKWLHQVL